MRKVIILSSWVDSTFTQMWIWYYMVFNLLSFLFQILIRFVLSQSAIGCREIKSALRWNQTNEAPLWKRVYIIFTSEGIHRLSTLLPTYWDLMKNFLRKCARTKSTGETMAISLPSNLQTRNIKRLHMPKIFCKSIISEQFPLTICPIFQWSDNLINVLYVTCVHCKL